MLPPRRRKHRCARVYVWRSGLLRTGRLLRRGVARAWCPRADSLDPRELGCESPIDPLPGTRIMRGSNMPLQAGTRLGPYEVLSRVGAGGMGEVWLASELRLGRK